VLLTGLLTVAINLKPFDRETLSNKEDLNNETDPRILPSAATTVQAYKRILISLSQKFRSPPKLPNFGRNFAEFF
jgi:hypothetical protein